MVDIDPPEFGFTTGAAGINAFAVPSMDTKALLNALESTGPRFAWGSRALCPCTPNADTEQYDPVCPLCRDNPGIIYYGPQASAGHPVTPPAPVGLPLTPIQLAVLGDQALIRGVTYGIGSMTQLFSVYGHWRSGDCFISVAQYNQLGIYDRLIALDSQIPYADKTLWKTGDEIATRYVPTRLMFMRTLARVLIQGVDYALSDAGILRWVVKPDGPTWVSMRYLHHPTWIVTDQPHVDRLMQTRNTTPYATPLGTPEQMMVKAHLRLEFLTNGARLASLTEED